MSPAMSAVTVPMTATTIRLSGVKSGYMRPTR